jgi:hypothetical protein
VPEEVLLLPKKLWRSSVGSVFDLADTFSGQRKPVAALHDNASDER